MSLNYNITKSEMQIRSMLKEDVYSYIKQYNLNSKDIEDAVKRCIEILESEKSDYINLYFTILYKEEIIGAVITKYYGEFFSDGIVYVDVPNKKYKFMAKKVKDLFEKLCRETYLYDSIVFSPTPNLLKVNTDNLIKIQIAKIRESSKS